MIGGAVSCSGFLICFALCCLTLITAIAVGAAIMRGMLPTAGTLNMHKGALDDPCNWRRCGGYGMVLATGPVSAGGGVPCAVR